MKIQKTFSIALAIIFCLAFCFAVNAQTQNNGKNTAGNSGIIFKIPKGVMPVEWSDFKGVLMLDPKNPSGIFISYPNEGEAIDKLKARAEKFLANMFVHDEKKTEAIAWQTKSVPVHQGDKEGSGLMKVYDDETQTVQITTFERESNGLTVVYGYFARKSKTSKDKDNSGDLLDDQGKGSKKFDEFWKTFPNK